MTGLREHSQHARFNKGDDSMNNIPVYLWVAVGAAAGAVLALILPGLDLGFGIAIGVAIGIAISSERTSGWCQRHARRPQDQTAGQPTKP